MTKNEKSDGRVSAGQYDFTRKNRGTVIAAGGRLLMSTSGVIWVFSEQAVSSRRGEK